jgi:hypothetical protein
MSRETKTEPGPPVPAIKLMETKLPLTKSKTVDALASGIAIFLTDYFRIRIHEWFGLSNPLSASLGLLLAFTLAWLVSGPGNLTNRTFFLLLFLGSVTLYFVGVRLHF